VLNQWCSPYYVVRTVYYVGYDTSRTCAVHCAHRFILPHFCHIFVPVPGLPHCLSLSHKFLIQLLSRFLADRTNGRAYAVVLGLSSVVCLSSVTSCIVAKRCVLEQKLLLTAYSLGSCIYMRNWFVVWYHDLWPWPLFRGHIKVTSTIALHLTLNISETVRDRGLVPTDHQQEMAYGLSNTMTSRDLERSNSWPQYN